MMRIEWSIVTILIVMAGISMVVSDGGPGGLDCRRFVFAPACRGATIKRSSIPSIQSIPLFDENAEGVSSEVTIPKYQVPPIWMLSVDRPRPLKVHWAPVQQQHLSNRLSQQQLEDEDVNED